jgi:hypothetical protein
MRMNDIDYRDEAVICRGFIAYDDTRAASGRGYWVFHEGLGLGEHIIERARRLRNSVTSRWQPTCALVALQWLTSDGLRTCESNRDSRSVIFLGGRCDERAASLASAT